MDKPDLESFDCDELPPHLHDIGQEFRDLMLFTQFNVPPGDHLDHATRKLLEARDACYQAVVAQRREERQASQQLALELQDEPQARSAFQAHRSSFVPGDL